MLIALYARVSTQRQENEETIGTQILAVKKFAEENGHIIVKEYLDDGWSGTLAQRPALDSLRLDAAKGVWDGVMAYDPDRIARDYILQGLVIRELESKNKQVLFVTLPPISNNQDRLLYGVKAVFADYERLNNAEKFRLGKLRRASEGRVIVSEAPYGYQYLPKGRNSVGEFKINVAEAEVVKQIFNWVGLEGLSIRQVIKRLQELKISPRKSVRGVWSSSTLSKLLRNATYIGKAHFLKTYAVEPLNPIKVTKYKRINKTSRRFRDKSDWIEIPVDSLVEVELFNEVQRKLSKRNAFNPRNKKNEYLVGGFIYCSCGNTRAGEGPMNGKHLYYRCSDRIKKFPLTRTCFEKAVNARIIDKLVWSNISNLLTNDGLLKAQLDRFLDSKQANFQTDVQSTIRLESELTKVKEEVKRYLKAFGSGYIEENDLSELISPLKHKETSLKSQIELVSQEEVKSATLSSDLVDLKTITSDFKQFIKNPTFEIKRKTLEKVLDRIQANQKQINVFGQIPVPITERNVEYESIHRNRRVA